MNPNCTCGLVCASLLASVASTYATQTPVAHWAFDEAGGPTAFDSAGTANGALVGGAAFAPASGIAGGAINVASATNGCVDMGNILPFTSGNFSIASWIKFATPGDAARSRIFVGRHVSGIVAGYFNGVNVSGGCYGQLDKAWLYTSDSCGGETISTTSVNDGAWHFVVSTYAAGKVEKIFIDGVEEDSNAPSIVNAVANASFIVGGIMVGSTPTGLFDGLIDDVQVYDRALLCREIVSMFMSPGTIAPGATSDLNGDGEVDGADLGILLSAWGTPAADLNGDGTTDGADLGILLSEWGSC
jgi:hypothetical protein